MKVDILNHTPTADRTVVACARGDYMDGSLVGVNVADDESYAAVVEGVDGETIDDKTRSFIKQLLRRGHFGPFEHPSLTFAIEGVSRSCMAQLTRHRHASFDVQSQRYVNFDDAEMVTPDSFDECDEEVWLHPDGYVQYNPDEDWQDGEEVTNWVMREAISTYNELVEGGVPEEDARMVLPIGTKVNLTATFNLRSLFHVIDMRHAGDAQWEARELAEKMMDAAEEVAPISMEMYKEHAKGSSKKAP